MFDADEIRRRISDAMPDATVTVHDMTGTADHYQVKVVSSAFAGVLPVKRHRMVYGLFKDVIGGALHALALDTKTPDE